MAKITIKDKMIGWLVEDNNKLRERNKELKKLCDEKDKYFNEMISDGLRHGSKLASKHMKDRKDWLNGK